MAEIERPTGPPPPWLDDFKRKLREALDSADPNSPPFNPPEGTSLSELAGHTLAVFIKKPDRESGHDDNT